MRKALKAYFSMKQPTEDLDEIGQSHLQTEGDIDTDGDNEIVGSVEGDCDSVGESEIVGLVEGCLETDGCELMDGTPVGLFVGTGVLTLSMGDNVEGKAEREGSEEMDGLDEILGCADTLGCCEIYVNQQDKIFNII